MVRKKRKSLLLDLEYKWSTNKFEEIYGENIDYKDLEQMSYLELKEMVNENLGSIEKVKFKKVRDLSKNNSLTCRLDMNEEQYEIFMDIYNGGSFSFRFDFQIKNIRTEEKETKENE